MALVKQPPRKLIRLKRAAEILGCSAESIKRGSVGDFKIFKLNNKISSPYLCFEADVLAFYAKVTGE